MTRGEVSALRVRTPEGVVFTFPLAGPASRFLAWLVDAVVVMAATMFANTLLSFLSPLSVDLVVALSVLTYFAVSIGYGIVMEWVWRGQTLGKKLLRLRVIDETGLPLGLSQVLLRNLLRAVDSLPAAYLVGGATMMLNPRAQRLGDIAAGTVVVRHRRVREPDFAQLFHGRYNSLREQPHLAARLRQQVPPELAAAGVAALLRRELLEPEARVALFAELAAAFRRLADYPPEVTRGMPDEAFVRDVIEIVHEIPAPAGPAGAARPLSV